MCRFFICKKNKAEEGRGDVEMSKLTERQKRFVLAFIEVGNATGAAREAGYSAGSVRDAPNWLNPAKPQYKPYLAKEIEARLKELESKKIATVEEILKMLTSTLRGEMKEEQVVIEGQGEGISRARIITVKVAHRERLKAAEMLLKRFPRQLDNDEQKARVKKLEAELKAIAEEKAADKDTVQIVDDLGGDDESETD